MTTETPRARTAEYMRAYRKTERGRLSVRVQTRASAAAVKWLRHNHPDVWSALLDAAWAELSPDGPCQPGRPRGEAARAT